MNAAPGTDLIGLFIDKGALGVIIIILLFAIRVLWIKLEEEKIALKTERDARLNDAKEYRDSVIKISGNVSESINDLNRVNDVLEKIMNERLNV